jgi:hypothetical protein
MFQVMTVWSFLKFFGASLEKNLIKRYIEYVPVYQCRGYVMNREKSEAKFLCIPDCHAFKMDLWCAGVH